MKSLQVFFWSVSIVSLFTTLPIVLFLLMPAVSTLAKIVLLLPDPRFILLTSFFSAGMYALIENMHVNTSSMLKKYFQSNDYYLNVGLSLLTSYFFWNGFSFFNRYGLLTFILLSFMQFFFYIFYLAVVEDGYIRAKRIIYRILRIKKRQLFWHYRKNILIGVSSTIMIVFGGVLLFRNLSIPVQKRFNEIVKKKIIEERTPHILDIQPYLTYQMTKVVLTGDNFGWLNKPTDIKSRLLLNGKQKITADLWTDTEIIFTIPMDWKLGENTITLEKYIEYDGRFLKSVSNMAKFAILSATDGWGYDDDLYFEQLKMLDQKVLKMNGYN